MRAKLSVLAFLIVGILIFTNSVSAQRLDTMFTRKYIVSGMNEIRLSSIAEKSDHGFLVAATLREIAFPYIRSAWMLSLNQQGDTLWTFRLRDSAVYSNAAGLSAQECADGNNIFLATVGRLTYLVKVRSTGGLVWKTTFDTLLYPSRVLETTDHGFIFGARKGYSGTSVPQVSYLFKTDGAGTLLWKRPIEDLAHFRYTCMNRSLNGYLVGCSKNVSQYADSILIVCADLLGNRKWSVQLGRPNTDSYYPSAVLQLGNGNILVSWNWFAKNGSYSSSGLTLLDSNGNKLWEKDYSLSNMNDIAQTDDSTVMFAGLNSSQASVGRINLNGDHAIRESFNYKYWYANGISIIKPSTGGYCVAGYDATSSTDYRGLFMRMGDNPTPVFGPHSNREILENKLYRDTAVAVDLFPGEILRYYLIGSKPNNMRLDSMSGIITWTPLTEADSGNHLITVRAKDRINQEDTVSWVLHVTPVNDPPVITAITPLTGREGDSVVFKVSYTDEEKGSFNYLWELNGMPVGSNSSFRRYFDYSNESTYTLHCRVFDAENGSDTTVIVTIDNTPLPPAILKPDSGTITLQTMLHLGWKASSRDPDLDSGSIRYRLLMEQDRPSFLLVQSDTLQSDSVLFGEIDSISKFALGTIYLRVEAFDRNGYSTGFGKIMVFSYSSSTSIALPAASYPSDFSATWSNNGLTIGIPYSAKRSIPVSFSLCTIHGRIIKTFSHQFMSPGVHRVSLGALCIPAGRYFWMISAAEYHSIVPCVVMN